MAKKKKPETVHVKLTQAMKYKGPATGGKYGAFPRVRYAVGDILCVPTKYFENVLEGPDHAEIIDLDQAQEEEVRKDLKKLKIDELRAIVTEYDLFPEGFEGSGQGGSPTKADLLTLVEDAIKDGRLELGE